MNVPSPRISATSTKEDVSPLLPLDHLIPTAKQTDRNIVKMPDPTSNSRKVRRSNPKVRTGCITCKWVNSGAIPLLLSGLTRVFRTR